MSDNFWPNMMNKGNSKEAVRKFELKHFGREINDLSELKTKTERNLCARVWFDSVKVDDSGNILPHANDTQPTSMRNSGNISNDEIEALFSKMETGNAADEASAPPSSAAREQICLEPKEAELSIAGLSSSEIVRKLSQLRSTDYASIRDERLALCRELTKRGQMPPSLRGLSGLPQPKDRNESTQPLMIDQHVIDLEWIHRMHRDTYSCVTGGDNLERMLADFCANEFSLAAAIEIASTAAAPSVDPKTGKETPIAKYEALGILPEHQPEMCFLRPDDVRARVSNWYKGQQKDEQRIRALASSHRQARENIETWIPAYRAAKWLAFKNPGMPITPKLLADTYKEFGGGDERADSVMRKLRSAEALLSRSKI